MHSGYLAIGSFEILESLIIEHITRMAAPMNYISTEFHANRLVNAQKPDLIISSSDGVLSFVHRNVVQTVSSNQFNLLLSVPLTAHNFIKFSNSASTGTGTTSLPCLTLPENSQIINIVLHFLYSIPQVQPSRPPTLSDLCGAIDALATYGITPLDHYVTSDTTLFHQLIEYASQSAAAQPELPHSRLGREGGSFGAALRVYMLGSSYGLHGLAVAASEHLLAFPLTSLSDEDAEEMGAIYVNRLVHLQRNRLDAIKRVMFPPQYRLSTWPVRVGSSMNHTCDSKNMEDVTNAWILAAGHVILKATPHINATELESMVQPVGDGILCAGCRRAWRERVEEMLTEFSEVKVRSQRSRSCCSN